ncbi:TasA family protein [Rathayibacter oskolensis]|nr:TasA family protein [Rathayibacter oskolensis]
MTSAAPQPTPNRRWKKIALTGGVLLAAGALAGAGAFAVFTDSDTASTTVDAGQLDIEATGTYVVEDIAPGDTVQRPLVLELPNATNDGDLVSAVRFSQAVEDGETLGTDDPALDGPGESLVTGEDGLTYTITTCTVPWVNAPAVPGGLEGPYTCAGVATPTSTGVLADLGTAVDFEPGDFGVTPTATGTFPSDAGDVALNMLIELELPTEADNDYENAAAEITFTAAAIQRDGIQK